MNNFLSLLYKKLFLFPLVVLSIQLQAQSSGSKEVINGYMAVTTGCTHASVSESIYIGPGTYLINGTWRIYSKNIWISPSAIISGSGTISFYNPSAAGGTASSSLTDGNNSSNFINVNIALNNASDMTLTDLALPADISAAGWANTSSNASLSVGANFNFAVANGDVLIGNHDMTLSSSGTLSNYQENRFVVTSASGHLVKQNFTGAFIFPVGIAPGDYTPTKISNVISNSIHVNVTNYDGMLAATFPGAVVKGADGVNRAWNIYADNATGNSAIDLEHNDSTEGSSYNDNMCFVTRFVGISPNGVGDNTSYSYWESNAQAGGTGTGTLTTGSVIATASERTRSYTNFATTASAYNAWYSKASNLLYPLPLTLISFNGIITECGKVKLNWVTAKEKDLSGYEVEQSGNGISFIKLASLPAHLSSVNEYSFSVQQSDGISYYRLKMIEANGKIEYSKTITVSMNCGLCSIHLYPLPFTNTLVIKSKDPLKLISVFDVSGRMIRTRYNQLGSNLYLDGSGLPAGTYIIRIMKNDGSVEDLKAIKK
jgi:hypothetical protein